MTNMMIYFIHVGKHINIRRSVWWCLGRLRVFL